MLPHIAWGCWRGFTNALNDDKGTIPCWKFKTGKGEGRGETGAELLGAVHSVTSCCRTLQGLGVLLQAESPLPR